MAADIYSELRVRDIVREETDDMRRDLDELKGEVYRVGALQEDLHDDIKVLAEVVSAYSKLDREVMSHAERLEALEAGQAMLQVALTRPPRAPRRH